MPGGSAGVGPAAAFAAPELLMSEDRLHVVFGTGQVGHALAAVLAGRGLTVRVVSRHRPPELAEGIDWRAADATDPDAASDAAKGAAVVYQCLNAPYTQWPERFPPLQRGVLAAAERSDPAWCWSGRSSATARPARCAACCCAWPWPRPGRRSPGSPTCRSCTPASGQRISASTATRSWRASAARDTRRRSPAPRALATTRPRRGWPMSRTGPGRAGRAGPRLR